ncbi:FtsK/SpoIIIE domain-containing protein (plasmid) [Clostridium baratii]
MIKVKNLLHKVNNKLNIDTDEEMKLKEKLPWNDSYIKQNDEIVLGRSYNEREVTFDLNKTPNMLIVANEGMGRTVVLQNILWQMINKDFETIVIDLSNIEYTAFHKKVGKIITDLDKADDIFDLLVREHRKRIKLFRETGCRDIKEYNYIHSKNKVKRIGVVIDNPEAFFINDKNIKLIKNIEKNIEDLSKYSCITGISLFIGVRARMYKDISRNLVENIPLKLCTSMYEKKESISIIGNDKVTHINKIPGRMILKKDNSLIEFQGYYFDAYSHLKEIR